MCFTNTQKSGIVFLNVNIFQTTTEYITLEYNLVIFHIFEVVDVTIYYYVSSLNPLIEFSGGARQAYLQTSLTFIFMQSYCNDSRLNLVHLYLGQVFIISGL